MIKKLILILLFQSVVFGQVTQDLEKARKIELLKSTRGEVENVFGNMKSEVDKYYTETFDTDSSTVVVSYSLGLCKNKNHYWNVPEWVAIEVLIMPTKDVTPKEIRLKLSEYKKTPSSDVVGGAIYSDDVKGIKFDVMGKEVKNITLYPSSKYNYLKCEGK